MAKKSLPKIIPLEGKGSIPAGDYIYYICLICYDIINSNPPEPLSCKCRNISVDPDAGRGGSKDPSKLLVLSLK